MLRIYLAGRMAIEGTTALIESDDFPGRQGRLAFAYLVLERSQRVSREQLGAIVWPETPPATWDRSLSALISRLRTILRQAGSDASIASGPAGYFLDLPADAWIDVQAAANELDVATGLIRDGSHAEAWGPVNVAVAVFARPFLPDVDSPWADRQRRHLGELHARALDLLAQVSLANGEAALAAQVAQDHLALSPYDEASYRHLMEAQVMAGNRAQAMLTWDECRRRLAEDLGIDPSPETMALHRTLLDG